MRLTNWLVFGAGLCMAAACGGDDDDKSGGGSSGSAGTSDASSSGGTSGSGGSAGSAGATGGTGATGGAGAAGTGGVGAAAGAPVDAGPDVADASMADASDAAAEAEAGVSCFGNYDLITHWRFQDDFTDSAGSADSTSQAMTPTFIDGQAGRGLNIDANGEHVVLPGHLSSLGADHSKAAWIRWSGNIPLAAPSPGCNYGLIYASSNGVDRGTDLHVISLAGGLSASQNGGEAAVPGAIRVNCAGVFPDGVLDGQTVVTDGNWHHVVGVCDHSANEIRLYVDGVLDHSKAAILDSTSIPTAGSHIGGFPDLGLNCWHQFTGDLDEITIFNSALDAAAAGDVFTNSPTRPYCAYTPPQDAGGDAPSDAPGAG